MGHGTPDMASFAVRVPGGLTEIGLAKDPSCPSPRVKLRSGPPLEWTAGLRLPLGIEHGGVQRHARRLARPHHELEGGEIPLAGIERGGKQRLALAA
jgi:hypothetical protein